MKTIVIIGGIILAGATTIAIMMDNRNEAVQPAFSTQGIPPIPPQNGGENPRINPAHGQAGHRCDLAVGAPLVNTNGTPVPVASPQNINSSPQTINASPAQQQPAPAGLKVNPAHGLPGHRCDLQVGAPL